MFKWLLTEKSSKWFIGIGFLIIFIGLIIFRWNEHFFDWDVAIKSDKVGQLGDFIGGIVGSIWALAGVILFYVALNEQREDIKTNKEVLIAQVKALEQQIEEFELQREELAETREVFKIQSETLKLQQFESTFFNLLGIHQNNISDMDVTQEKLKPGADIHDPRLGDYENISSTGRDCFVFFKERLESIYKSNKQYWAWDTQKYKDEKHLALYSYIDFFKQYQPDLGHYYRTLYHIFKFVNVSDILDKNRYTSIVRAQLSNDELVLLFYNGITEYGEKFKPLIEDFHVFKNLNLDSLLNLSEHKPYYSESAYKKINLKEKENLVYLKSWNKKHWTHKKKH
ncbi:putative phage abortive infection protein [Lentimicrobium sp. S6]|uniref:putative phage abortive infection protein n=1 Tax=Lentimicrobium sp. S6 TaxID=2735872 RepID=UPI001552F246|nr:putative phage abortive infection protein [Lentimicrobium sp. S6]NPD45118.1 hypothetical protein [Lentimicrobium sp. S6]